MNIDQLIQSLKSAKQLMREHGEKALKAAFQEFFDACPEIVDIRWTQYTPYFNDGDSCEFSVGDPSYHTQEQLDNPNEEDLFYEDSCYVDKLRWDARGCSWHKPPTPPRSLTADEQRIVNHAEKLSAVFALYELMEMTFGDHVRIIATRDGFTVEGYDHD